MVFCGLCKEAKEPRHNWSIMEQGAEKTMGKFRICDDCAAFLLKNMAKKVLGVRDGETVPTPLLLNKTGIIDELALHGDNSLEITIALDISKARRWYESEVQGKPGE
jgi:hypothetical protein